jgi:hypothetical protein
MGGRVSAGRQFVVAADAADCGYPPNHAATREITLDFAIRRKVSLDFAKFDWNETREFLKQLVLLTCVSLRHIRCRERAL